MNYIYKHVLISTVAISFNALLSAFILICFHSEFLNQKAQGATKWGEPLYIFKCFGKI